MILSIGTILIIEKDFTKDGEIYKSRVVDIRGEHIMIDYPTQIETGRTAYFMNGTQLFISFTDDLKRSFAFKAEIIGRSNESIPMLQVIYPGDDELIKIQRREFVRIETPIDVAVVAENSKHQLVGEDISAGGIAVNLPPNIEYSEGEMVDLFIVLPFVNQDTKYVKANGEIVRVWEDNGRRIMSIRFEDILAEDRQQIVRFCFEKQLQMRNEY